VIPIGNQPAGRMTVLSLPEHLQGQTWTAPQEIEVRLAGELIAYGLTTGLALQRVLAQCADPACAGHCGMTESLRLDIEIAPEVEAGG
jgi:hypothetical protein